MGGPIERTSYELRVDVPVGDVLAALVEFGPDRPRIWRETSHPDVYRVHRIGETDAEVTEGVPFAWSRERYDWATPGTVLLTQLDSNVARNGTIRYLVEADGRGSRIRCDRYREFHGLRGRVAGTLMGALGPSILKRQLRAGIVRWSHRPRHAGNRLTGKGTGGIRATRCMVAWVAWRRRRSICPMT